MMKRFKIALALGALATLVYTIGAPAYAGG